MSREPGNPAEPPIPDPANPFENPRAVPSHAPLEEPPPLHDVPAGGPDLPPIPSVPGPLPPHPLGPPEPQP